MLKKHIRREIGINYDQNEPDKYNKALLKSIGADHFVVEGKNDLSYYIPFRYILNIVEPTHGDTIAVGILLRKFSILVQIYHMVIYKGAIGVSMPVG